jgi:putative membrane protein insertion efficiency factor
MPHYPAPEKRRYFRGKTKGFSENDPEIEKKTGKSMKWLNRVFIFLLKGYKKYISPVMGKNCRFYPTCSQYAVQAFSKYSFLKAFLKSFWRVLRCNPFHPGGYDPVDKKTQIMDKNIKKGKSYEWK